MKLWLPLLCCLGLSALDLRAASEQANAMKDFVPDWAKKAVWYQIFPERFRNGDTKNGPTLADIEGAFPFDQDSPWQIHPWTSDWYAMQPYERANGKDIWFQLQRRRYGGDLQGVIDKLDYLQDLGVGVIESGAKGEGEPPGEPASRRAMVRREPHPPGICPVLPCHGTTFNHTPSASPPSISIRFFNPPRRINTTARPITTSIRTLAPTRPATGCSWKKKRPMIPRRGSSPQRTSSPCNSSPKSTGAGCASFSTACGTTWESTVGRFAMW
jgi:hypothetical protein